MARLTNLSERGLETRRQLRDVLLALAIEKGYDRVTISDITSRAGIDRSTFYLHYKDKDELFEASRREVIDELVELRGQGSGPFPGILLTFEHMAKNPALYLVLLRTEAGSSDQGGLEDYIAASMRPYLEEFFLARGLSVPGGSAAVSRYLTGALAGLARSWLESGMSEPPARIAALFIELARGGLQGLVTGGRGQKPSDTREGDAP